MNKTSASEVGRIFLTGGSGYVGGRLAPRLLEAGHHVRCLARSPEKLRHRPWGTHENCEIVEGQIKDVGEVAELMKGCRVAYYLIHSMLAAGKDYASVDRTMAETFARAAQRAGVERIIYLGGLGEMGEGLSHHLRSRREVEHALASAGVPVTSLRAAMIIGSGSASFEILRYLVERLPVMITPKWVSTECQPIAIDNVLGYLQQCLTTPATVGRTLDIGGSDVMSYWQIMHVMAEVRGLPKRRIIPVPVLTPHLSSLWIHLVTPLSAAIARPLAEGLKNRVVCRDDAADQLMPQQRLGVREAIAAASKEHASGTVETSWSMAGELPGDPDWAGGQTFVDAREVDVEARPADVFTAVCRLGGGNGWYAVDWLWRIRGAMDRLVGGPGLRRGRRNPDVVYHGEALDFWRVVDVEQDRRLRLRAEMKLPGTAELEFEMRPIGDDRCRLSQTARFRPKGLLGLLYWYSVVPFHGIVFKGMLRGIQQTAHDYAEKRAGLKAEKINPPKAEMPALR